MQNVVFSAYVDGFTFNTIHKIYATLSQKKMTTFNIKQDKF